MAIALGNLTTSNLNPGAATQTLAHNHGGGTDDLLLVHISMQNTQTVSGIEYDGVTMTEVRQDNSVTYNKTIATFFLLAPSTGSNNIVVTFSGGQFNPTAIFAQSFSGASGIGNSGFNDAISTPNTQALTISENSIIFATGVSGNAQSFGYQFDGVTATNFGNGFNINNIVEGAFSQTGLSAGSVDVATRCDVNTITNHRVEIQEAGGGGSGRRRIIIV